MRNLTQEEVQKTSGGLFFDGSFVKCMGSTWWSSTSQGAIGGAVFGAFAGGGGAVPGAIIGAVAGSTGAFGYCLVD